MNSKYSVPRLQFRTPLSQHKCRDLLFQTLHLWIIFAGRSL